MLGFIDLVKNVAWRDDTVEILIDLGVVELIHF